MIQSIISYLNAKLQLTGYFESMYELSELIKKADGKTAPKAYCSNGEFKDLSNYDHKYGQSYWRKNGDVSLSVDDTQKVGCLPVIVFRIPLKLVCFIPKSKITDNAYSDDIVAQALIQQLTTKNTGLRSLIKAKKISVIPGRYTTDNQSILNTEYSGFDIKDIRYKFSYLSIDFEVEVSATKDCLSTECEIDSDILHIFDFCDAGIRARLTAAQEACLIAAFCDFTNPQVTNSVGLLKYTLASGAVQAIPKHDIINFDGSILESAEFDQDTTLAAVTVTSSEGVVSQLKPGEAAVCTPSVARTYAFPAPTGQTVSYATRDAAWVAANYFNNLPEGKIIPKLDFFTLNGLNSFGNNKVLTNATGQYFDNPTGVYVNGDLKNADGTPVSAATLSAALTIFGEYTIDNYTGMGIYRAVQSSVAWATSISNSASSTLLGYSDWFVCDYEQGDTIVYTPKVVTPSFSCFNYAPFFFVPSTTDIWTSSTRADGSFKFYINADYRLLYANSGSKNYILFRKHF